MIVRKQRSVLFLTTVLALTTMLLIDSCAGTGTVVTGLGVDTVGGFEKRLEELERRLDGLNKRCKDESEHAIWRANFDSLNSNIESFGNDITAAESRIDASRFRDIQARFNTLKANAADIEGSHHDRFDDPNWKEREQILSNLNERISRLEKDFEDKTLQDNVHETFEEHAEWQQKYDALNNALNEVTALLNNSDSKFANLSTDDVVQKEDFDKLSPRVQVLQAKVTTLNQGHNDKYLDDLEGTLSELDDKIVGLESRLNYLGGSAYQAPETYPKWLEDFNLLKGDINQYSTELAKVKPTFNNLDDSNASLKRHFGTLETRFERLQTNTADAELRKIAEMRRVVDELGEAVTVIEQGVAKLAEDTPTADTFVRIRELSQLREDIDTLKPDFEFGRSVRDNLGNTAQQPAAIQVINSFNTADERFGRVSTDVDNAETAFIEESSTALSVLGTQVNTLENTLKTIKSLPPEQIVIGIEGLKPTVQDIDDAFTFGDEIINNVGTLAKKPTATRLINDFYSLNDRYNIVKPDLNATKNTALTQLSTSISSLDGKVTALERDYKTLGDFAQPAELSKQAATTNVLDKTIEPFDVNYIVSTFSRLKSTTSDLDKDFETTKAAAASLPPGTEVIKKQLETSEKRYNALKQNINDSESTALTLFGAAVDRLERSLVEQETAVNALVQYDIPAEFSTLVNKFAQVKSTVQNLAKSFTSGHVVANNIGSYGQVQPGQAYVTKFNDLEQEYNEFSTLVADIENEAYALANSEINTVAAEVIILETDLNDISGTVKPEDFGQMLQKFFNIRNNVNELQDEFALGSALANDLGPFGKTDSGKLILEKFNWIRNEYELLRENIASAERVHMGTVEKQIDSLGTDLAHLNSDLLIRVRSQFNTPNELAHAVDIEQLINRTTALEKRFDLASSVRNVLEQLAGNRREQATVTKFDALQATFNGLKVSVNDLNKIK
ncbi:MAG: hypothetical protein LBQ77_07660 [Treponema sp.]|jgi:predicted nuclease with TOPRIM domain|nr:hypothetical protein [Treponema sp.]